MLHKINKSLPTWYANYGQMISEQEATIAVFSDDENERLRQYLDSNENLLTEIQEEYRKVGEGELKEAYIELETGKYKVQPGDGINIIIDKTDDANPVVSLGLENEEALVGDLNLSTIAGYVYKSMDGPGTDELQYASSLAAIHMDLAQRGVSERGVQKVFNIFNSDAFGTKYEGESLDQWIDGDFDGRAEACAMAIARRPIPKSIMRGISWGTIFTDIGMLILAIPTLGGSLAATGVGRAALAGGKAATKVGKALNKSKRIANITNKAKAAGKAIKAGKTFQRITKPMIQGWSKLSNAAKLRFTKKAMPVGSQVEWIGKSGAKIPTKVGKYFKTADGKYMVQIVNTGGKSTGMPAAWTANLETLLAQAGKPMGMSMEAATKLSIAAGLTGAISKAETGNFEGITGEDEQADDMFNPYNPAELMGYYDQTVADPAKAMNQYRGVAAADLAVQLHDAMDGWTDNSDEMAIALMILSMDKLTANAVKAEYESSFGANFYDEVIASELESDMEAIVGCYWAALTGDGPYVSQVQEKLAAAKK